MKKSVAVIWNNKGHKGQIVVRDGRLGEILAVHGGKCKGNEYVLESDSERRLIMNIEEARLGVDSNPTIVSILDEKNPFSFFLRDVSAVCPIFIPDLGVAVTETDDKRDWQQIADSIQEQGLQTLLQRYETEPEESYENSAAHTRDLICPTWLGLSRDMRLFEIDWGCEKVWSVIQPRFHGVHVPLPENENKPVHYHFMLGRGAGCVARIHRRIEEGRLPILCGEVIDDDITYHFTAFASLEYSPLTVETLRGTHFLVADGHGAGHMFTPEQEAQYNALLPGEMNLEEETVLYFRVEAVNTGAVPRYAWLRTALPNVKHGFDGEAGFGCYDSGRIFSVSILNSSPLPKGEIAQLLKPGEYATLIFALPHRPISRERAAALSKQDFNTRYEECRRFWKQKLEAAARIHLPEKRLDEMVQAGINHLDLVAFGREPDGPVAATIGVYCPIGSESSPIIQFMDSMGLHDLARRSLEYFLEKQHEDGFIQNFGNYMLETGPALWSLGEQYRYTRDLDWVRRIAPKVIKSCDYMLAWRRRNRREELRGRGYGMMEGKVGDPEDPYHIFMLNGYGYMGLKRSAEMLRSVNPAEAERLDREAEAFKQDIRDSLNHTLAHSPAVPLSDGTWCPTVPAWAEAGSPPSLYAEPGNWYTHGATIVRDSLVGAHYLIFQEVVDPSEPAADWILNSIIETYHTRNVAFCQPFYSCHPWIHLQRGEVGAFLKAYYNEFSGLADRETYTFWEHYFHASPHKTHEEGWFLLRTRWMLYLEEGETLRLLPGIPRRWLEPGQTIELTNVASYFGPISLSVSSDVDHNRITARVECRTDRAPKRILFRLPHPEGRKAITTSTGIYDAERETVCIEEFKGEVELTVTF